MMMTENQHLCGMFVRVVVCNKYSEPSKYVIILAITLAWEHCQVSVKNESAM